MLLLWTRRTKCTRCILNQIHTNRTSYIIVVCHQLYWERLTTYTHWFGPLSRIPRWVVLIASQTLNIGLMSQTMCKQGCGISPPLHFISPRSIPTPPPIPSQSLQMWRTCSIHSHCQHLKFELYVYGTCPKTWVTL